MSLFTRFDFTVEEDDRAVDISNADNNLGGVPRGIINKNNAPVDLFAAYAESAQGHFTQHRIPSRGYLVDVETTEFRRFVLNPTTIEDSQSINWADMKVIGVSHPSQQYVNGENREIRFKLQFDRGLLLQKNINIEHELAWLTHFKHPSSGFSGDLRRPPRILLYAGRYYSSVLCTLVDMKVNVTQQFTDLTIRKAEVDITLREIISRSDVSERYWQAPWKDGAPLGEVAGEQLGDLETTQVLVDRLRVFYGMVQNPLQPLTLAEQSQAVGAYATGAGLA